jgi:hypothetical protein
VADLVRARALPPSALLPLPNRRNTRQAARSSSDAARIRRNVRGATAATDDTSVSRATVNLDPDSNKAIQVDRSVKDPDKFEGKVGTFYPWLTAVTLKLSTTTFRTEGDGLRYVQGFLRSAP